MAAISILESACSMERDLKGRKVLVGLKCCGFIRTSNSSAQIGRNTFQLLLGAHSSLSPRTLPIRPTPKAQLGDGPTRASYRHLYSEPSGDAELLLRLSALWTIHQFYFYF